MADKAHMVKQVIHYSDGSETVINYRGVIEDGVLTPDKPEDAHFASEPEVEAESEVAEEVTSEEAEISEE